MFDSNAVLRDTIAENIGENKKIARIIRKYLMIIFFMKINTIEVTYSIAMKKTNITANPAAFDIGSILSFFLSKIYDVIILLQKKNSFSTKFYVMM